MKDVWCLVHLHLHNANFHICIVQFLPDLQVCNDSRLICIMQILPLFWLKIKMHNANFICIVQIANQFAFCSFHYANEKIASCKHTCIMQIVPKFRLKSVKFQMHSAIFYANRFALCICICTMQIYFHSASLDMNVMGVSWTRCSHKLTGRTHARIKIRKRENRSIFDIFGPV